jgi:hypothetical protein
MGIFSAIKLLCAVRRGFPIPTPGIVKFVQISFKILKQKILEKKLEKNREFQKMRFMSKLTC